MWDGKYYQNNILLFEYKNGQRISKSSCSKSDNEWWYCPSGNKFKPLEGGFRNRKGRQGKWLYLFDGGAVYEGEWKDSKFHGHGTYTWADGDKYIGEYKNNKKDGYGTYFYANGDKYIGEYKNNVRDGVGVLTYDNGKIEEGIWKEDKFLYSKKKIKPNFNSSLVPCENSGLFNNCYGMLDYPNGDRYVGQFKDNMRHGQGTYYFLANNEFKGDIYIGEFKNDKYNGQGTYTWGPGTKFEGDKYQGGYRDNKKYGQGTYTWSDGSKFVGEYRNGKRNGQGIHTFPNGTIKKGIWKDGKFLYKKKKSITPSYNSKLQGYKNFCEEIGFTPGTEKFGQCVMKAMEKG